MDFMTLNRCWILLKIKPHAPLNSAVEKNKINYKNLALWHGSNPKVIQKTLYLTPLNGLSSPLHGRKRVKHIVIEGRTPPANRSKLVDEFQTQPACRAAVLSIMAAGVGLTLTARPSLLFHQLIIIFLYLKGCGADTHGTSFSLIEDLNLCEFTSSSHKEAELMIGHVWREKDCDSIVSFAYGRLIPHHIHTYKQRG